jgi:hypothetical protein
MASMKKHRKTQAHEARGQRDEGSKDPSFVAEVHVAISEGFLEYRRKIADIQARHGRKTRRVLEVLS